MRIDEMVRLSQIGMSQQKFETCFRILNEDKIKMKENIINVITDWKGQTNFSNKNDAFKKS